MNKEKLIRDLQKYKNRLFKQTTKTLRVKSTPGDLAGVKEGLKKVLGDSYDRA